VAKIAGGFAHHLSLDMMVGLMRWGWHSSSKLFGDAEFSGFFDAPTTKSEIRASLLQLITEFAPIVAKFTTANV
jgi:hypothetical protein